MDGLVRVYIYINKYEISVDVNLVVAKTDCQLYIYMIIIPGSCIPNCQSFALHFSTIFDSFLPRLA